MSDEENEEVEQALQGGDFHQFVTRLSFQGLLALGLLENPITKTREKSIPRAILVLDDLRMLREKTVGNLETEEEAHIDRVIDAMQMAIAQAAE